MRHKVDQVAFDSMVGNLELSTSFLEKITRDAKKGHVESMDQLCAAFARVAFITPEAIPFVYDVFTRTWLGLSSQELQTSPAELKGAELLAKREVFPKTLSHSFWGIIR